MIALDTNLLVYAHRSATGEHLAARAAIETASRNPAGWGIPAPVVSEFWSVVTHPASLGGPSTPQLATDFLRALVAAGAQVLDPQPGLALRLAAAAEQVGLQGPRIFDLQIGLIAVESGAHVVWTHDTGFLAPPGLNTHDPLAGA